MFLITEFPSARAALASGGQNCQGLGFVSLVDRREEERPQIRTLAVSAMLECWNTEKCSVSAAHPPGNGGDTDRGCAWVRLGITC